ncbi:hypothetical protein LOTGIDRAFT_180023 [Lottia gigantea]|uniref:Cas1p 10 TM acyl transferase domain-containing protein n=1 Tax=Lottia gigantea TaxID=225164 RepID=V4AJ81_LOTGI|nr:hypothetical protein LOTGIDRAFT_180023 [Lottia gigantea]ESP04229.1 hypothetical protein LOTGIDRAFT_180023 [Lottia gigantea]
MADRSSTREITHYLNVENAKIIAFLMVAGFVMYHSIIHLKYGNDSCKWLMSDGRFPGYHTWQPYGCMTHKYTKSDARMCMHYLSYWGGRNHIVFLGDSRIRQLYFDFVNLINRWSIKLNNGSKEALNNFEVNLTTIQPLIKKLKDSTKVLWLLQDPVDELKLNVNRSAITNEQIDDYNKVSIDILENSPAMVWSSSRLVAQGMKKESPDGLHISQSALELDSQILINMYCNNDMNHNDGTCCNTPETTTPLQIVTFSVLLVCIVSAIALFLVLSRLMVCFLLHSSMIYTENASEIFTSLAKLAIIMFYFYLCDRTNFFMKENKYYTHVNFFLPFAYVMILGFFFTENTEQTALLHRDQTDEWKGWMQLVILIYHLTGASKVLPIYMHIRVLVSSYLFLTGFGHFTYFWTKGEYSLFRFCQVLFRLNLLVICLCFVMNRPYQFYYFVPLVSYWFLIMYITMAIWPHLTKTSAETNTLHYIYMIVKFIILATCICLFYLSEVFFEKVFLTRPFKGLFVTSDDSIHEWRFRWQLDRFSVLYGMIFAFAHQLLLKYKIVSDTSTGDLFSKPISTIVMAIGVAGIAGYTIFSCFCRNKLECNEFHSYLTFLPIISYIVLRNVPGWLRTRYSSFFAWFGRISLELFIVQYHIWLAADTHGVLVLIPSYPVLNVIITSFIFICVSHEMSKITNVLVKYAVPSDWKSLLRNLILFIAILLPIGITNGMFS